MADEDINNIKIEIEKLKERVAELENKFESKPQVTEKGMSIKEFLISTKPKNDVQRTLAIGYYFEKHKGMKNFNAKNIEEGFREAKEKPPKTGNFSYLIFCNARKGFMTEDKESKDKSKYFYLTRTGEEFVERGFRKEE